MAAVKRFSALPGFGLAIGYTLFYLTLIVLIPLAAVGAKTLTMGWPAFWKRSAARAFPVAALRRPASAHRPGSGAQGATAR